MKPLIPTLAIAAALLIAQPFVACAAEGAPQLALKQDFERADSIRDWHLHTPKDAKAYALALDSTPNAAHAGQAALKYEVTQESEKERYIFGGAKLPDGEATANRMLRVRFYARTAAAAGDQAFAFRVLERDATKPTGWLNGKTDAIKIESSTEWKEYSFTGKMGAKTEGLTLYVVAKKPVLGQTVWIDDLSVEVVPTAAQ